MPMLEQLITRPDPLLYFAAIFPLSLIVLALGYRFASHYRVAEDEKAGRAFSLSQAAIFGLIALIMGFSFSFAAGRYEVRNTLVVSEADAIRATYLRGGFLPVARVAQFRKLLIEYTKMRLKAYSEVGNARAEQLTLAKSDQLQGLLWVAAASTARRDPRSPFYADLTRSVIDIIAMSEQQEAALNNHVPRVVIGIIFLCTLMGAFLVGLIFGRAKSPHFELAVMFCLLFSATVFTIIDLDHPQGGFINVDVAPLQLTLDDMTSASGRRLIRSPVPTPGNSIPP